MRSFIHFLSQHLVLTSFHVSGYNTGQQDTPNQTCEQSLWVSSSNTSLCPPNSSPLKIAAVLSRGRFCLSRDIWKLLKTFSVVTV